MPCLSLDMPSYTPLNVLYTAPCFNKDYTHTQFRILDNTQALRRRLYKLVQGDFISSICHLLRLGNKADRKRNKISNFGKLRTDVEQKQIKY